MNGASSPTPGRAAATAELTNRLHRIEGQVHGITAMIESGKPCLDTLTQIAAARGALQAAALTILDQHLRHCLLDNAPSAREASIDDASASIARLVRS
ncbi:metal-sensitive transcriptional regulator [Ornithinimicrobium pekingense]|uniref:Metal-sensitive transcriptional regulator n=1 Tax=Ornithinimicrobium pekingense TaxID=384677 RepID=A0ABQ2F5F3_9MICO|nr:metal-sensitive transcriptional regulator [Ornithinimicrobium pekingense]GGK63839.1 hypothetical protein GCM10011509_10290 [Ornithinimicrobium pekingense]